jgi:alpha-mannosidase
MYHKINHEVLRIKEIIKDLYPYQYIDIIPINNWEFEQNGKVSNIEIGYEWNYTTFPVIFRNEIKIPKDYYGEFWFGGETLIKIDGKPYGEINEYHKEIDFSFISNNINHIIEAEVVPYNLFGTPSTKTIFEKANFIKINHNMRKLIRYFVGISQLIELSNNESLNNELSDLINKAFKLIELPRETSHYLSTIERSPLKKQLSTLWSRPQFEKFSGEYINVDVPIEYIENKLYNLRNKYPKIGNVYISGHAHIDYAWLWPIEETKRKIVRTFSNAVLLAKKYKDFTFTQSSAQMYKDIENTELFENIKNLISEGKWDANGGMWVESDTKIPSLESLIRQFYYAQLYFKEKFGEYSNVCWLPDVFGFSWILPQIAKQAKIELFFTTKMTWNEKNDFPYDICYWKGIDGSKIIYHSFKNPKEGYDGFLDAECILKTFNNFRNADIFNGTLLTYGYGDGGGGPSEEHMIDFEVTNKLPFVPKLIPTTGRNFSNTLKEEIKDKKIPVWDNELYFEFHRATHFSQLRTKRYHKFLEDELFFSEGILALKNIDNSILENSWKKLLTREFHDILPGSSIKEVYDEANNTLSREIERCKEIVDEQISSSNDYRIINFSNYESDEYFISDKKFELLAQRTYDGKYLYKIDALDKFTISKLKEGIPKLVNVNLKNDDILENENYLVEVYKDGMKILDKKYSRELFDGKGNKMMIYEDIPLAWGAWDIDYHYNEFGKEILADNIEVVENGELRKVIKTTYKYETSKIEQYIILNNNSQRIDIKTNIDWHLRKKLLKVIFPIKVLSRYARFDISGGYITRPTHKNTSYEQAMFEVYMHRWVDISEPDFGVAILNDGLYSSSIEENVLDLSLLHGPIYPDLIADEGTHEILYSIMSHPNNIAEIYKESEKINKPLKILKKELIEVKNYIDVSPLKVIAFYQKENKKILRLVEVEGRRGKANMKVKFDFSEAYMSNILGEKIKEVDGTIEYEPFKIYTVIFEY